MDTTTVTLSSNEKTALDYMAAKGAVLITQVEDANQTDVFGCVVPGRGVFKKLIKKGLVYETEEPVLEDGFQFTPSFEITDEGLRLAKHLAAQASAEHAARRSPRD